MNLKEQQYICTAAECGSITKAAEKLFITQPALSLYISNLEKVLGIRLFDRIGKQLLLTPAGELYVEKAQKMLEMQREFDAQLRDLKNFVEGELSVGVQLRRAPLLLPPAMARFRERYPHIRVAIREGVQTELEAMMAENRVQLLIYNAREEKRDLHSIPLYEDCLLLAVPGEHPLNQQAKPLAGYHYDYLDLGLCRREFFILPTKRQSLRTHVDRIFADIHLYTGNCLEVRNLETAMSLVNEGYGLGFNREQYTRSMTYLKNVRYYIFDPVGCRGNWVYVGYKKGREAPDYAHHFIEVLAERGRDISCGCGIERT